MPPIAPEMVVFDWPETVRAVLLLAVESAAESVSVVTPAAPLFVMASGCVPAPAIFAAMVWLADVNPLTLMSPAALLLLSVIVCDEEPMV